MSSLQRLLQQVPAVHAEYFAVCRAAEEARERERQAAVVMQKYARGFLTRRRIDNLSLRVTCIQRAWRGYLGRQRAHLARKARDKRLREMYFAAMATTIQRHWRGFWSRKYVFDFHARKLYLARVAQLNAKMRAVLAEEGERAAHAQKALAHEAARAAFDEKVSRLHHLLSTNSQPGIFASPYALAAGTIPVIAGAPVEEHLKAAFRNKKATLKPASATATSSDNSATGPVTTFLPPIKSAASTGPQSPVTARSQGTKRSGGGDTYAADVYMGGLDKTVPRNLTLRQVVPYDTVHIAQVLESKVIKAEMMTRHPVPFSHSLHKLEQPSMPLQSNVNLEAYHDPYDPTVGARTDTFTPQQQALSPTRFTKFTGPHTYFDQNLLTQSDSLPPKAYHTAPPPKPVHAAGLSNAEVRRRATKPAR